LNLTVSGAIEDFLKAAQFSLIFHQIRGINKENFVSKIEILIPFIEKSTIENILFISSTSVYGDDNDQVTEETVLNPDSEGGKQLAIVEGLCRERWF
jgi:nucleoside-diphosphate-sugar epimerase